MEIVSDPMNVNMQGGAGNVAESVALCRFAICDRFFEALRADNRSLCSTCNARDVQKGEAGSYLMPFSS